MNAQEFERRMSALLPGLDPEAMKSLVSYAEELDRDGTEQKEVFFRETYIEYSLVKEHDGEDIAQRLINYSKTHCLNPFEIRGAANYLRDDVELDKIAQMSIDGLCDREGQEWQESKDALEAFEESWPDTRRSTAIVSQALMRKENGEKADDKESPARAGREQEQKKQSITANLRKLSEQIKAQRPDTATKSKDKNTSL